MNNTTATSVDMVSISHPSLADSANHVRMLDAGSGQKAAFIFSDKTSEISAILVSKDGVSLSVSAENLPKNLGNAKTLDSFNHFLDNAHARGVVLSDGEAKIYVEQKGLGGAVKKRWWNG